MLSLALLGHPVAHSRSPELHAAFGRQLSIELRYNLIDVSDGEFEATLTAFIAAGGRGANVTLPFKRTALEACHVLSARARSAGAVNVLKVEDDGRRSGDNTDGIGLLRDLTHNHGLVLRGMRVAVLGGSGAARGAVAALLEAGADLRVADRDPARCAALLRDFPNATIGDYAALANGGYQLLINATSASLRGELPPLPAGVLAPSGVAYDVTYADTPTPFQSWALRQAAQSVHDGWGMLVEQAAASFAFWTGRRPTTDALLRR